MHINPHPTQMDSYNKYPNNQGTLIANWQQQRQLRDHQGQGRSMTSNHFPKTRATLYDSDSFKKTNTGNNTSYRVHGYQGQPQNGTTQNYYYGKGTNKSETYKRVGPKQQLLQQMYLRQVESEFEQKKRREQQQRNKRELQTTHKDSFIKHNAQDLQDRVVGRRVMRDQDGKIVPFDRFDQDLMTDFGLYERRQITSDQQLRKLLPLGQHYSKQQALTFWRQKIGDGNFYMSKPGALNQTSFNKNNQFLKSYAHYKNQKD